MPSNVATINEVSRQLLIYGGFFLSFFGIIGSCANLYLFTRPRYRCVPCATFMLTGAFFDLVILSIALLLYRVVTQLLQYDPTVSNIALCKVRLYVIDASLSIPIWCICLSTFNRYCVTSRHVRRREWCTFKRSIAMIACLVIIFFVYRSPDLLYADAFVNNGRLACIISPSPPGYRQLQIYVSFPVIYTTVPLILILTLVILTRANLRLFLSIRTSARIEQQITSMVLLQALGAACLIPYAINLFYLAIRGTSGKSDYQLAVENLITQIVTLGFYAHYASAFYIYLLASRDIRRRVQRAWHRIKRKFNFVNRVAQTR